LRATVLAYLSERQGMRHPRVEADGVRDYLTHLAVRQKVSAGTQNQAFRACSFSAAKFST
jgi:hypothetical protein